MLEICTTQLPDAVQYCLDGAVGCGEIDGCTSTVLRLYGDRGRVAAIADHPRVTVEDFVGRMEAHLARDAGERDAANHDWRRLRLEMCARFMSEADDLLPQLDPVRRGALVYDGFKSVNYQLNSLCEVLADWALTDTVEGGSLERFKTRAEMRKDGRRGTPYKRTYRMLCSPSFIRRYVKRLHSEEIDGLKASVSRQLRRLGTVEREHVWANPMIWHDMNTQLAFFAERRQEREDAREREFWRSDNFRMEELKIEPPPSDSRRKVLKRASVVASSILGAQAVGALARGEKIKIEGPTMGLELRRQKKLSDSGHGCLDVTLCDLDGQPLASLCIYQDNIPALDQAVGFAMMVQSGMEKELLTEGNIINTTPAGDKNEVIRQRIQEGVSRQLDRLDRRQQGLFPVVSTVHGTWTFDVHKLWREKYWRDTKQHWLDTVAVAVFGRQRATVNAILGG